MAAILNEEPVPVSQANPRTLVPLVWIIERCLAKEPGGRYSATDDLARDLATLRNHVAGGLAFSGSFPLTARSAPAQRRGLGLAAAVLAVLACGFAAWASFRPKDEPAPPSFRQLTFRRGQIFSARFSPDGHTILYSAAWDGRPMDIYVGRPESPESRP